MARRTRYPDESPWPPNTFVHHIGQRFAVGRCDPASLADWHLRNAWARGLQQSFKVRCQDGGTVVAFANARYAHEALGLLGVGRIQLTWGPRSPVYLIARAAIDPLVVAKAFLSCCAPQATLSHVNVAHLEMALEGLVDQPLLPDSRPRRGALRAKKSAKTVVARSGTELLFTPNGGRVDAIYRLYQRECDRERGLARLEVGTGTITPAGGHEDCYLRPDSTLSVAGLMQTLGSHLADVLRQGDFEPIPKPPGFRGIPASWYNNKSGFTPPQVPNSPIDPISSRGPWPTEHDPGETCPWCVDPWASEQGIRVGPMDPDDIVLHRMTRGRYLQDRLFATERSRREALLVPRRSPVGQDLGARASLAPVQRTLTAGGVLLDLDEEDPWSVVDWDAINGPDEPDAPDDWEPDGTPDEGPDL